MALYLYCFFFRIEREMASAESQFCESTCVICLNDINSEKSVTLGIKGLKTMVKCALAYGKLALHEYLLSGNCIKVHDRCRLLMFANYKRLIQNCPCLCQQNNFVRRVIPLCSKHTAYIVAAKQLLM